MGLLADTNGKFIKDYSTLNVVKTGTAKNGGFYIDVNSNGAFDTGTDFQTFPLFDDAGSKAYYSVGLINAAVQKGIFPVSAPPHLANDTETGAWWATRDGANNITQALVNFPNLLFIVEASVEDQVQVAADHPHVFARGRTTRRGKRAGRQSRDRQQDNQLDYRHHAVAESQDEFGNAIEPRRAPLPD